MPHAVENTNGAPKRGSKQQVLNGSAGARKISAVAEKTDYTKWRMKNDRGCQTWHYMDSEEEEKAWPQTTADRHFLGMDTVRIPP